MDVAEDIDNDGNLDSPKTSTVMALSTMVDLVLVVHSSLAKAVYSMRTRTAIMSWMPVKTLMVTVLDVLYERVSGA